jgi:hypothetical protein
MKTIFNVGRFLLQFVSLGVFLRVAFHNGSPQPSDWLNAFLFGGAAAVFQTMLLIFFSHGYPLNRIILGVNLYLIVGGAAVLTGQMALLETFNSLKESGIFLCMLVIGVVTTTASKAGFVGAAGIFKPRDIRYYSIWLLFFVFVAVVASFWFRGQMMISAAIPLIALSVATRFFKVLLKRNSTIRSK